MRVVFTGAARPLVVVAVVCLVMPLNLKSAESLWKPFAGGVEGNRVDAMIQFNGDLIVGGQFTKAGGVEVHNAARWDGSQWHAMGIGTWNTITQFEKTSTALFARGGDIYGQTLVAYWNGTDWIPVPDWQYTPIDAMTAWDDKLVLGGTFFQPGNPMHTGLTIWDGSDWLYPDTSQILINFAVRVVAMGNDLIVGPSNYFPPYWQPGSYHRLVRFDGTAWHAMENGLPANTSIGEIALYNGKLLGLNDGYSDLNPVQAYEWQDTIWIPTTEPAFVSPDSNALPQHSLHGLSYGTLYFSFYEIEGFQRISEFWDGTAWRPDISGAYSFLEYDGKYVAGLTATATDHNVLGYRTTPDADGDLVYDYNDNCPTTANVMQADTDKDGIGDACDPCFACERTYYLDHVEGSLRGDTLLVATPITMYLGMSSFDSAKISIISSPFLLSSPDGASWQTPAFDTMNIGWMSGTFGSIPCHFSFGQQVPDGQSPDTMGMVASAKSGMGFAPGYRGVTWKIATRFDPSMSGKTICLDTGAISADVWIPGCGSMHAPLGGPRTIGGLPEWNSPRWLGPYCFTIWNCSNGMTGNVDCDNADGVDISDLAALVDYLYISQTPLCCPLEANTDGVIGIDIADLTSMIDYLYISFHPLAQSPQ